MLRLTEWDINHCDLPGVFWHFDVHLQSLSLSDCFLSFLLSGQNSCLLRDLVDQDPAAPDGYLSAFQLLPVISSRAKQGGVSHPSTSLWLETGTWMFAPLTQQGQEEPQAAVQGFIPLTFNLAFYALQRFHHKLRKRNRFFFFSSVLPVVPMFLFISFN